MRDDYLFLLLLIIKNDGNIYHLASIEYDFAQVSRHLRNLKEENIIEYFNETIQLTKKGEEKLDYLYKQLGYKGNERWISPQVYYHKNKTSLYEVYLPQK